MRENLKSGIKRDVIVGTNFRLYYFVIGARINVYAYGVDVIFLSVVVK